MRFFIRITIASVSLLSIDGAIEVYNFFLYRKICETTDDARQIRNKAVCSVAIEFIPGIPQTEIASPLLRVWETI